MLLPASETKKTNQRKYEACSVCISSSPPTMYAMKYPSHNPCQINPLFPIGLWAYCHTSKQGFGAVFELEAEALERSIKTYLKTNPISNLSELFQ